MYVTLIKGIITEPILKHSTYVLSFLLYTLFIVVRTAKFVPRKNWVVTGSVSLYVVLFNCVLKIMH